MDVHLVAEVVLALLTGLMGIILTGVAWWVKTLWALVTTQQERLQALHVKFGEYVPRPEIDNKLEAIFNQVRELTRVVNELAGKVQYSNEQRRGGHN